MLKISILKALQDAALKPEDIGCINAHSTSTPMNDRMESRVIYDMVGRGAKVISTKGVTGHCRYRGGFFCTHS